MGMPWNTLPVMLTVRPSAITVLREFLRRKFLSDIQTMPTAIKRKQKPYPVKNSSDYSFSMYYQRASTGSGSAAISRTAGKQRNWNISTSFGEPFIPGIQWREKRWQNLFSCFMGWIFANVLSANTRWWTSVECIHRPALLFNMSFVTDRLWGRSSWHTRKI